ncbi:hypothetical protein Tco_0279131, partial [Tanacetum coccineum]
MSSRKRRSKQKIMFQLNLDLGANANEIDDVYAEECFEDAEKMEECSGDVLSNIKECLDMVLEDEVGESENRQGQKSDLAGVRCASSNGGILFST